LVLIIFIFILLATFTEQKNLAMSAAISAGNTPREETPMLRKTSRQSRKVKRDKFQFELLEPRQMFSASGGLTLDDLLALRQNYQVEHQVETPDTADTAPPVDGQADQQLDNLLKPIISVSGNTAAQTSKPFQLSADVFVISNVDLTVKWSLDSGPGTATFSDATKIDSTVQFNQAGTYKLKFVATNGGQSNTAYLTVNVAAVNVVNIDQAWLNNPANQGTVNGRTVYILKEANKTFQLQTDVTTAGTAFYIANKDITFDLNGHTITYNTDNLTGASELNAHTEAPHGVVLYLAWHNTEISTIAGSAAASNCIIKNGEIVNAHGGALAHGIFGRQSRGVLIDNLKITTDGKDSHTVWFSNVDGGDGAATLRNCDLTTQTSTTFNRHAGPANVHVGGSGGVFLAERNILIGGNSGLSVGSNAVINENIIGHSGFVTNGYGVFTWEAENITITNNLILPTNGRGIIFNYGNNITATGNVILHLEKANEEFGESLNSPAVRSRYETSGHNYSDNISLGIGGGGYTSASSIYITSYGTGTSTFSNNNATTILVGTPDINHYAQPVTLEGTGHDGNPGLDVISGNQFKSNHLMVRVEGYDGFAQQETPLTGNSFDWVTGGAAYTDFMAAVEAKLATFTLTPVVAAAANTHIAAIDTLVDGLISGQGLQSGRAFWYTKYDEHSGQIAYADLIDSDFGEGVDAQTYGHSNLSTGSVKLRVGFTQEVQITNGGTPLADTTVTVSTAQGDSYTATTNASGFVTLTFYQFSVEKENANGASFSVIDRTQSTITAGGKSIVVNHSSIPSQVNMAGPAVQSEGQIENQEESTQSSASQLQQFLANREARQQQRLTTNDTAFENLGSPDNAAVESIAADQIAALVLSLPSQEEKSWRTARLLRFQKDTQLQESYEKALAEWRSFDSLIQ
jgi:hypothetical protein